MAIETMNPYAPPTVAIPESIEPGTVSLRNPARFLLYPLGALCVFIFLAIGLTFWSDGFEFTTDDFLTAGYVLLIGLFGITAFVLGAKRLSENTRVLTILWGFSAVSILVISLFLEPPTSIQDFVPGLLTGSVLLLVAILAFRSVPQAGLPPDAIEDGPGT